MCYCGRGIPCGKLGNSFAVMYGLGALGSVYNSNCRVPLFGVYAYLMICPGSSCSCMAIIKPSTHAKYLTYSHHVTLLFPTEYTLEKCKMLAEKVSSTSDLPLECKKFPDAVKRASMKKHDTKKQAFEGMQGRLAAEKNKKTGRESHAQIQRRLTSTRRFTKQK